MITMTRRWQDRAACVGMDPDIFFPEDAWMIEPRARDACTSCPVQDECRQTAIETKEEFGVWGGLTADQRRVLDIARHRARCPDCRSDRVAEERGYETCLSCGLSWAA